MIKGFKAPAWFSIQSPEQEDTIDSVLKEHEDLDALQKREMDKARAEALPYMSEVVRDLDSRTEAGIRGGVRTWTPEAWERVRRNSRNNWWKRLVFLLLSPFGYEHS